MELRGLAWDHPRCTRPMQACGERWRELNDVAVAWTARSLRDFGDQPLEDVAAGYDVLVIDHPFCGRAAATGCLAPLDELLDPATLAELGAGAVGASYRSYEHDGHQWALATDAACQVAAVRPDRMGRDAVPTTWDDVLRLARRRPGAVALALSPPHAICSWCTLVANRGGEPFHDVEAGLWAASVLAELAALGPPEALGWEPPDVLSRLTADGALAYVPLVFGYSGYGVEPARPCRFLDIPSSGAGPRGAVLGGAGLAVSAASAAPMAAAAFAAWASGADAQRSCVARNGGQPGHRAAWDDPELDALAGGFYAGTRATIEGAWVRPRDAWWPGLQMEAGNLLTDGLLEEDPQMLNARLHDLARQAA